ncbi:hypothetical protein [Burkholderia multivorans]|uniref:hypothetical protein n=1 Tax=Burkholderia multivorans TaxID=87883 RepID=UPI00207C47F7|nr:hypothetical protein [Burkholderia multivorans]MCO1379942.1 hypothetical protein [Burkholderia multivorans]UQP90366.1 hypothetical protein L0Y91_26910 [Burkholderia multivorans]
MITTWCAPLRRRRRTAAARSLFAARADRRGRRDRAASLSGRCSVLGRKQKRDSSTNLDVNLDIGASEKSAMRKTQSGERRS